MGFNQLEDHIQCPNRKYTPTALLAIKNPSLFALPIAGEGGEAGHAEGEGGAGQAALRAGGHP